MKLTLIRHTSVDVPSGTCYGQTDVPLRSTFPVDAEKVRSQLGGIRFDAVFTSPLIRCTRLAEACGYPDAIRDRRLMEMDFGDWEMRRWDEIRDPGLNEWYADYLNVPATGGESFRDQHLRVGEFITEISDRFGSDDNVAVFTHGGVIVQFLLISGLVTPETAFRSQPPYGGIVQLNLQAITSSRKRD